MAIRDRRIEWLRPGEILNEMARRPLIYLPVGPLEWHGPHLPIGTDPLDAQTVARRVADRTGGLVMPTLFCGTERENPSEVLKDLGFDGSEWITGMDFPKNTLKSLYLREEFMALLVRELLELLVRQGFRLIVLINGHGADNHIALLERLAAEYTAESPARVICFLAWDAAGGPLDVGHADLIETSRMMTLDPEAVDLGTLPPPDKPLYITDWGVADYQSFHGDPTPDFATRNDPRTGATPERGEETFEASVAYITHQVTETLVEMGYTPYQEREDDS